MCVYLFFIVELVHTRTLSTPCLSKTRKPKSVAAPSFGPIATRVDKRPPYSCYYKGCVKFCRYVHAMDKGSSDNIKVCPLLSALKLYALPLIPNFFNKFRFRRDDRVLSRILQRTVFKIFVEKCLNNGTRINRFLLAYVMTWPVYL